MMASFIGSNTISKPTPFDVLLGRGRTNAAHFGNKHYLAVIHKYHQEYFSLQSQREKYILTSKIVQEIQRNSGQFLIEEKDGSWIGISDEKARIKVAHSLQYYERVRKKDNPNQHIVEPVQPWNSRGNYKNIKSQRNKLHSSVENTQATDYYNIPRSINTGTNRVVCTTINQPSQDFPSSTSTTENEERQLLPVQMNFTNTSALKGTRMVSENSPHIKFSNTGINPVQENMQEEKGNCIISHSKPLWIIPVQLSQMKAGIGSSNYSKIRPATVNATTVSTGIAITTNPVQTQNDFLIRHEVNVDSQQQLQYENLKSRNNVNIPCVNTGGGANSIGQNPCNNNSITATNTNNVFCLNNEEIFPDILYSSTVNSTTPVLSTTTDTSSLELNNDVVVYDYEYENPLHTTKKKQEQYTNNASTVLSEYVITEQILELAANNNNSSSSSSSNVSCILYNNNNTFKQGQQQPLDVENFSSSYSLKQLSSIQARMKEQSFS